jgi:hypothetical protein
MPSSKLQLNLEIFHEIPRYWTLTSLVSSESSQKKEKMKKNSHLVNIPQNVEPNEDYIIAEPK